MNRMNAEFGEGGRRLEDAEIDVRSSVELRANRLPIIE
jgi:hypothetical protein